MNYNHVRGRFHIYSQVLQTSGQGVNWVQIWCVCCRCDRLWPEKRSNPQLIERNEQHNTLRMTAGDMTCVCVCRTHAVLQWRHELHSRSRHMKRCGVYVVAPPTASLLSRPHICWPLLLNMHSYRSGKICLKSKKCLIIINDIQSQQYSTVGYRTVVTRVCFYDWRTVVISLITHRIFLQHFTFVYIQDINPLMHFVNEHISYFYI